MLVMAKQVLHGIPQACAPPDLPPSCWSNSAALEQQGSQTTDVLREGPGGVHHPPAACRGQTCWLGCRRMCTDTPRRGVLHRLGVQATPWMCWEAEDVH